MTSNTRNRFSLFGVCLVLCCFAANATPPQLGNRLLQVRRDQMADALGESHPKVTDADARKLLEGVSRSRPLYRSGPASRDSKANLEDVVRAYNLLARENDKLKKRIQELESQLRACDERESQAK